MQATATANQVHGKQLRMATSIIALLGVLAIGVTLTVVRDDASSTRAYVPAYTEPKTNDNFRVAEMNALPEAPTLTVDRQQFIETNRAPEAVTVRPMTDQQFRFLEINQLPEAAPSAPVAWMRFIEINALPGDGAPLVAPSSDRLGERH
ncbi:MAG: hypothetical protein M3439_05140 [Chloroflexota bacterium]|nr:hypothetical protein [Chloroflexota bacterium]